jgi:PTS system galactitol-specific IIC component
MAADAGVKIPEGASQIGNLDRANLITWVLVKVFSIF